MVDVIKMIKELNAVIPPEHRAAVEALAATVPGLKVLIPTPGTESRLNGVLPVDISAVLQEMDDGYHPTYPEITESLGGNPKSPSDTAKVRKKAADVPELVIDRGRRTMLTVRRLTQEPPKKP